MSPNSILRKTFKDRTFSKMGPGSVRGSIFALCSAAIGAGVLSLPYVLALNGWAFGIIFLLIGALSGDYSNKILAWRACEFNERSYYKLLVKASGERMGRFMTIASICYLFGTLTGYAIIMISLIKYSLIAFGVDDKLVNTKLFSVYICVPLMYLVLYPLSLLRDMSSLRYAGLGSLIALFYTAIVLIIELPEYYKYYSKLADVKPFYFDANIFTGTSMVFYSFTCQLQMMPIYSELVKPNYPRMKKVITRAFAVDFIFYATISIVGYLSSF